uniref:Laminin IV type A domain-containing protein n=1 Tax=Hemiselmis tepida TaxID=464990 RepID=A0A7S0YZP3_9CRYP|mmetsp:Transcript_33776/g.86558  ORF Transcript_33776/g.86558 Transcript_33776/m.86558 type:complete len:1312 (+) Transcript_33776:41-3976(+)
MGAGRAAAAAVLLCGIMGAWASPGDVLARSDFRNHPWSIYAEKGTGGTMGLEFDHSQNLIKQKDMGDFDWWFEAPPSFLSGDTLALYNGTISFQLQSLEWQLEFKDDGFDVVLVSTNKFYTVGLKGLKRDGDTSVLYNATVHESAGWIFLNPKVRNGALATEVSRNNLVECLKTLKAVRVRGGYFKGIEKTQMRYAEARQGVLAGDMSVDPLATDSCCGDRQRSCQSDVRMELVFNNPGVPCSRQVDFQTGVFNVEPATAGAASQTLRLDPVVSSPVHDFYVGKQVEITGITSGAGYGEKGTVTNYLGALDWKVSSGVTALQIVRPGSMCAGGGYFRGQGGAGDGFLAQFEVLFTVPSVTINDGGKGCGLGLTTDAPPTRASWTVAVDGTGAVTGITALVTKTASGAHYEIGTGVPAIVKCTGTCTGTGLEVTCDVDASRNPTAVTVTSAGVGYQSTASGNGPEIFCAEGRLTATDAATGAGTGFDAVFASSTGYQGTVASGIDLVRVVNAGTGYLGPVTIAISGANSMCHGQNISADLSGYLTKVTVLDSGSGYTSAPRMVISNGTGCDGVEVRATISDMTADRFYLAGATEAVTNRQMLYLGLSASDVDEYYKGMTIVLTKGAPSNLAAAAAAEILQYDANGRVAYLAASSVTLPACDASTPPICDGYAITPTPVRVLSDAPRSVDFLTPMTGVLSAAVSSSGTPSVYTVTLDTANAPAIAGYFTGQVISFTTQSAAGLSAYIVDYTAGRVATIAVEGSAHTGYSNQIPSAQATNVILHGNVGYVVSQSYLATIAFTNPGNTWPILGNPDHTYTLSYRDDSARELAHAQARPFYCDQRVGDNPTTDWIDMPFREAFAFKATPLVCAAATLTLSVEFEVTWKHTDLTIVGEAGEVLGTVFSGSELIGNQQVGGAVHDSIAISAEKMIEMTGDGDFEFTVYSQSGQTGRLRFREMRLGFSPQACFAGVVATDQYQVLADALAEGEEHRYNMSLAVPLGVAGSPASDGVVTVVADADMSDAYLELTYAGTSGVAIFDDWVWGSGTFNYTLTEPADVSTTCLGSGAYPSFSCSPTLQIQRNNTRKRTAHHRMRRRVLGGVVSSGSAALNFNIKGADVAKISPVTLNYGLLRCWMSTLRSRRDGQIFGAQLFRPSFPSFVFGEEAADPGGDGTLWVHAVWKRHSVHVRDTIGIPSQGERLLFNDMHEHYDLQLEKDRDPDAAGEYAQSRYPHLGALGLHAGDQGEFIDWLFKDDYEQYAVERGFVTSARVPRAVLKQFLLKEDKRPMFSLDVPPGEGSITVMSAVLAYPLAASE